MLEDVIVLCGEGCAAALLSRCMGEWKAADTPAPAVQLAFAAA